MKKSQIVIKSAQVSKNTAYQGEIGRKLELSKRRKIQTPKKINLNTFKKQYRYKVDFAPTNFTVSALRFGKAKRTTKMLDGGQSNNFKKYGLYFKKKAWYRDKAAPIPGGNQKLSTGNLRKEKFYKKIFRAYRLFKTYQTFNKKGLNKACRKIIVNKDSTDFSTLMHMDSQFYSSMQKSCIGAFGICKAVCFADTKGTDLLQASLQHMPERGPFRLPYFLNGKYVTKKNFILYRKNKVLMHQALLQKDGDFCR